MLIVYKSSSAEDFLDVQVTFLQTESFKCDQMFSNQKFLFERSELSFELKSLNLEDLILKYNG